MEGHYHVGHNIPGYLPEGDLYCTNDPANALDAWRTDVRNVLDSIEDDGDFLDHDTKQNTVTVQDLLSGDMVTLDIHPVRYWIETVREPLVECEIWQDQETEL